MVALLSLLAGASLFTSIVSAQNLPACVQSCLTSSLSNSTCGSSDIQCLCGDDQFIGDVTNCIEDNCPPDEVDDDLAALESVCEGNSTTTSLDTSTRSFTDTSSLSDTSSPASTTSDTDTDSPTDSPTTSSGPSSRSRPTTPPSSSVSSTTTPTSTSSRGAAGKRAEILRPVGPAGVVAALGMVAGAFVLAF